MPACARMTRAGCPPKFTWHLVRRGNDKRGGGNKLLNEKQETKNKEQKTRSFPSSILLLHSGGMDRLDSQREFCLELFEYCLYIILESRRNRDTKDALISIDCGDKSYALITLNNMNDIGDLVPTYLYKQALGIHTNTIYRAIGRR